MVWYIDAVGVHPFRAPIYTKALPLPGAPGIKYGNGELLPLGRSVRRELEGVIHGSVY